MSIATANQTINWCPPIHRTLTPSTDPAQVHLPKGFTVLITGGSRGIGLATALSYAKAGASTILITGRNVEVLQVAVQQIKETAVATKKVSAEEVKVEGFVGDATSEADTAKLVDELKARGIIHLDTLILNAGKANGLVKSPTTGLMDWPSTIPCLDIPDFRLTFETNFFAGVLACKYLLPLLEGAPDPRSPRSVIWVTSSSIHHADPRLMAMGYSLSKFAAARFVEYISLAHGADGGGVTAFGIQPGSVMTDMGRYELPEGKGWEKILIDDVDLGGGLCVWLTKERRKWLNGRWIDARWWDVDELERRKNEIVEKDWLKFRMTG